MTTAITKFKVGRYNNTGYGSRFSIIDIGIDEKVCLIDPETAFWALVPRTQAMTLIEQPELISSTLPLKQTDFATEIKTLRYLNQPTAVYFNPTDRCNLNCHYCYLPEKMRRDGNHMSATKLETALEKLSAYFQATLPKHIKPQIIFHGSEPLLNKEAVFHTITKFKDRFRFGIQTNATLLEKEDIDFLINYGIGIGISLDAHNAEIGNTARRHWNGKGSFDKAAEALDRLSGYDNFNVICTVTKANVMHLTSIVDFLHEQGVKVAMLNSVRCTREGGNEMKPDNNLLAQEFIKALDRTYELYQETGRKLVIANFANILAGITAPTARRLMCDISPCGGGRCFFAVSSNGDAFPCSEFIGLLNFKGGNLFTDELTDILTSKPFHQVTNRSIENITPCKDCAIRHFCGSPCPAEVFGINKDLQTPSPYCEFYEEQVRYALRLIAMNRESVYMWDNWEQSTNEVFSY